MIYEIHKQDKYITIESSIKKASIRITESSTGDLIISLDKPKKGNLKLRNEDNRSATIIFDNDILLGLQSIECFTCGKTIAVGDMCAHCPKEINDETPICEECYNIAIKDNDCEDCAGIEEGCTGLIFDTWKGNEE